MIKLSNIKISRKYFDLNIENFTVEEKKCTLLLGSSGCGKTTFLKLLSGFIERYDGEIVYDKNSTVSIMLQNPINQMITPTVETELKFTLHNQRIDDKIIEKKVKDITKFFEIDNLLNSNLRELSFGELQKVMLCATFLIDTDCFLLDEPTSHLDYNSTKILYNYIHNIIVEGKTVIISSQNFDEYLFVDKVIIMENGKIVEYIDSCDINENKTNIEKYGLKSSDDEIVKILKNI